MPIEQPDRNDDTIRLPFATKIIPPSIPLSLAKRGSLPIWAALGVALGMLLGGIGLYTWPSFRTPVAPPFAAPTGAAQLALSPIQVEAATSQEILNRTASALTIYRLAENPRVLVLDFPSLKQQGRMLDRIAAQVEKAQTPKKHLLNDADLQISVKAIGETPDGYYYGHDYSAAALTHFFALADRDEVALTQEEIMLRRLLQQEGWFGPGFKAGLISLPTIGADKNITRAARLAILNHELAHGEYFANPEYAAYVNLFWKSMVTTKEQSDIRAFLMSEGYDSNNEELVENEAQAYLMFTVDPTFFSPTRSGMAVERRNELQARFHAGMKASWLRDVLTTLLPPTGALQHR